MSPIPTVLCYVWVTFAVEDGDCGFVDEFSAQVDLSDVG